MPTYIRYDHAARELIVGSDESAEDPGIIENVDPAIWEYAVGGMPIVKTWFEYRKRRPKHKKLSSDLDAICAPHWTEEYDDELLQLLNVLGRCVDLEPWQAELLDRICDGPQVSAWDLESEALAFPGDLIPKIPRQLRYDNSEIVGDSESGELSYPAPRA